MAVPLNATRCGVVHSTSSARACTEDRLAPVTEQLTRQERKERTRQAILAAALELSEDGGLATLSLRSVAKKVGIVPTAFYRHFASVEELGLALLDESFGAMREMLREVRQDNPDLESVIQNSVTILVRNVNERRDHFLFVARERIAGPPLVREAIHRQLELFELELAMDLGRLDGPREWSNEDLRTLANLIVSAMIGVIEAILSGRTRQADVVRRAEQQLRMVTVGAANWNEG
jgi:AcrR family transcriptional regulator